MVPGTWESTLDPDPLTGFSGDDDPIDVVELSGVPCIMGHVYKVHVCVRRDLDRGTVSSAIEMPVLGQICSRIYAKDALAIFSLLHFCKVNAHD